MSQEPRPPLGLTPRGAVLLLALFALAATAVYPLRQYVSQQDRIERLQAKQAEQGVLPRSTADCNPGSQRGHAQAEPKHEVRV